MASHTRRTVLAGLTGVGLAGCTSIVDSDAQDEDELPDQCPTSQDLDVEWPRDLGLESAAEFVTKYEEAYLFEQEQGDSELVDFNIETQLNQGVSRFFRGFSPYLTGGFQMAVHIGGSVTIYGLDLQAVQANPDGTPKYPAKIIPDDSLVDNPEYIPINEIEDWPLQELLKRAADSGTGRQSIHRVSNSERYIDLIANLPSNSSSEDNKISYFNVNGTLVLLAVSRSAGTVGDSGGTTHYYITENVVWRSSGENESPRDGTLVECRPPE